MTLCIGASIATRREKAILEGSGCAGGLRTVTYSDVEIPFSSTSMSPLHYKNTPMQCTAIFHGCKTDNFHIKICDIFHCFCSEHGLDAPWNRGVSNGCPCSVF